MPGFKFRFYKVMLAAKVLTIKFIPLVFFILVCVIGFMVIFGFTAYHAYLGLCTAIITYTAYLFLIPVIYVIKNGNLYAVLDKYGFSEEYLKAFHKAKILNKPFDLTCAAKFAEIYINMGQPEKAVEFLGAVTLPENPSYYDLGFFLYVYILALLKTNDLEKAEELWAQNNHFINMAEMINHYSLNSEFIFLTEIYIECFAASKGDESRLEYAYELTVRYMDTNEYKKSHIHNFEIILVYELKALGMTEEFDRFYPTALLNVGKDEPIFKFAREMDLRNLEKAANGKLPFIN